MQRGLALHNPLERAKCPNLGASLASLEPFEVGLSPLLLFIAMQEAIEIFAMPWGTKVYQFMEQDVIEDVIRGSLETIGDADGSIDRGAGAPTLAHLAPTDRCRALMEFWKVASEKLARSPFQFFLALSRSFLASDYALNEFRKDL